MGILQKLFTALFYGRSVDGLEAESHEWMVQCPCGFERSIWDLGGVRYGARSVGKRYLLRCTRCGRLKMHRVYKKSSPQL